MLIQFDSKSGRFSMFDQSAVPLLKMMGHSGTVPGAILAADIPAALEKLRAALAALPESPADEKPADDGKEPPVSLRQRAFPLVDLLERAARNGSDVVWDRA